jgi:hypothetical protein
MIPSVSSCAGELNLDYKEGQSFGGRRDFFDIDVFEV